MESTGLEELSDELVGGRSLPCVLSPLLKDRPYCSHFYSAGKALDLIPEVYASLENVQATAQLLETFANNLDEIVNETRERRSA